MITDDLIQEVRDKLVRYSKSFCGVDGDELVNLSMAVAIRDFKPEKGKSFTNFAFLVFKRDLYDRARLLNKYKPKSSKRVASDVLYIAKAYRSGKSLKQIAAEIGCCHATIYNRLEEVGVERRPFSRYEAIE